VKNLKVIALLMAVFFASAPLAGSNGVLGEKLDSGLGELAPGYTAKEFMPTSSGETRVLGEKLDSGLGELTREDIARVLTASNRTLSQ
jgi:hypothetical protein